MLCWCNYVISWGIMLFNTTASSGLKGKYFSHVILYKCSFIYFYIKHLYKNYMKTFSLQTWGSCRVEQQKLVYKKKYFLFQRVLNHLSMLCHVNAIVYNVMLCLCNYIMLPYHNYQLAYNTLTWLCYAMWT